MVNDEARGTTGRPSDGRRRAELGWDRPAASSPLKPERIQREPIGPDAGAGEARLRLADLDYWRITAGGRALAARFRLAHAWAASAVAAVAQAGVGPAGLAVRIELRGGEVRLSLSGWGSREPSLPAVCLAALLERLAEAMQAGGWSVRRDR